MLTKIRHLFYVLFKARSSGLRYKPYDLRNYKTEQLGWGAYTPKNKRLILPTKSVKNQKGLQTCQWNATTVQKEPDENVVLSVRSLVIKGKEMGLVGAFGESYLDSGQKVLKAWGALPESICPDVGQENWDNYINFNVNQYTDEAAKHKIASYWQVTSLDDVYRLLDQGRILTTGMGWYSGFNQGGGFSFPWIIDKIIGWFVGGHALAVIGYDVGYQGKIVLAKQNSYGASWGDAGKLYVELSYFLSQCLNKYGCFVNLDDTMVTEPWVAQGKALYDRIKTNFDFIERTDVQHGGHGELYEMMPDGISKTFLTVSTPKLRAEFDTFLRQDKRFTGVSEADFSVLIKYMQLQGLKINI